MNSNRVYNDPAVTKALTPIWNKIDNLKHELDLVLEDKAKFENSKVEWGKRHKFSFWCRSLFTIKDFTRNGIIKIASYDTMHLIEGKIKYINNTLDTLKKSINVIKYDVINNDPLVMKKMHQ